ncbi:molybdate ABC transporter substrate-binding protein [Radiobacillus sp. PE A8.2]|uniref:molybdate ABC transporter substrate-binding protein n=1 Tax=Radiobacillus sp. PE A8.2 TaxID=3380349 RepID=UPI00388F18A2
MKKRLLCSGLLIIVWLTGCALSESEQPLEVTVSAAASMTDAMTEIVDLFENEHPEIKILLNIGSSGALQQQILQGAPVDVYVSAAEDKFERLVLEGMIDDTHATNLLGNSLVLIQPKEADQKLTSFEDLDSSDISKLAIGTPETVPAGKYAKETLISGGIYDRLQQQGKLVFAKDVRAVLTYVETGNVDAGIVYHTDALTSENIKIVAFAEERNHTPIVYPVGVINGGTHHDQAVDFYQFLKGEQAMSIFEQYGFVSMVEQ